MNHNNYLHTAALSLGKLYTFIVSSIHMKRRYVILHFMLVFCLLFIPIFTLIVRTQPSELYMRVFSQDFENATVVYHNQEYFSLEKLTDAQPMVHVFDDFVVYADTNIVLSAPSKFFVSGELSQPFGEVFGMIAVYNLYIPHFLLPMILIAFVVLLAIQTFFYLISAAFLGLSRLASTNFSFNERVKIVIMSSLFPALLCTAVGFVIPAVHIALFQMVNLLLLFYISKRFDKTERDFLLSEDDSRTFIDEKPIDNMANILCEE